MFSRKAELPPAFQVPAPADDHPSWVKVGVIAAVGFAIGIAWPRLAGIKVGPNAPEGQSHPPAAALKTGESAPSAAPMLATASVAAPPSPPAPPAPVAASNAPNVTFGRGFVLSCKTNDGEALKGAACGSLPGFDALAQPRFKKLAQCPAADAATGKLAVLVTVDFAGNHLGVDAGKTTTVASPDGLYACLRTAFQGAGLGGIDHENARYTLLYNVMLASPDASPSPAGAAASAQVGAGETPSAQVVWETALVRDAPRTGQIVARLQRGAKLHLGLAKDGWYPVKYGADFGSDGWVYRGAIGK